MDASVVDVMGDYCCCFLVGIFFFVKVPVVEKCKMRREVSGQKENLLVLLPEVVAEVRVPEFSFWLGVKVFGANLRRPLLVPALRPCLRTANPLADAATDA